VLGSRSGRHTGQALLADDGATVVFKPSTPFMPGEQVTLAIGAGLRTLAGAAFAGSRSAFSVAPGGASTAGLAQFTDQYEPPAAAAALPAAPAGPQTVALHPQDYVTFPDNFPAYTVTVPAANTAPGLLFLAPFFTGTSDRNYLFIADDSGEPVFWQAARVQAVD